MLDKGQNATYTSNRHIHEVTLLFGQCIVETTLESVNKSPYYSIMIDETTDVATTSQLIIYIRYLKDGKSNTSFAEMIEVPNWKANTIMAAILKFLDVHHLQQQKMCAFGSDGAAVMVGRKAGVGTQLNKIIPHLLQNHCVAHRLALASGQAAAKVPYLDKFKKIVEQLYRFYSFSAVRTASLCEIQNVLNEPLLKMTEAKDVRWLSHDRAIRAVRLCLPAVVTSLEYEANEKSDAQAQGLSVFIQTYEFVAALLMMSDVLPVLAALSRALQSRDGVYSLVGTLVTGTISTVKALKENPGEHFQSLPQLLADLESQPFRFHQPSNGAVVRFRENVYDQFLDSVVANLEKRFPNIPELEAFSVFSPQQWPEERELLEEHGVQEVKMLAERFSVETDDALSEYRLLKHTVTNHDDLKTQSTQRVMEEVAGPLAQTLPVFWSFGASLNCRL